MGRTSPVVKLCMLLLTVVCLQVANLSAQTATVVKASCVIPAKGSNTVTVKANFQNAAAKISFDPANLWGAFFDITIDITSLTAVSEKNEAMLKSAGFLNSGFYPEIKFTSARVYCDSGTQSTVYHVDGKLTVKDMTQPVTIDLHTYHNSGQTVFKGKIALDRQEWHLKAPAGIADDMYINIETAIHEE